MRKLYEKSELTFTIVWIVVYCVLQSLANPLNQKIGVEYSASAIFSILQSVILLVFLVKNNLLKRYGLCKSPVSANRFLFYIPLIILATRNFWNGAAFNLNLIGTVCYIACMLCVGFLEEVIFRGLLFKAIAKDNVKTAIIISSVTFGLGHLLNLVNGSGAEIVENLFTHSAINITSVFANVVGLTIEKRIIFQLVLFAITIAYSFILTKTLPKNQYYDREDN